LANTLNWGLLATGNIAKAFARGLAHSKTGKLRACGSRDKAKAEAFGAEFNVPCRYSSYEELLADKDIQAVYISTPHPMHAEWTIKAAEAGKHILCEKPIGLNHAEAMACVEAAVRNDVFLMEAYMYRCHPQTAKIVEIIKRGTIGQVRVIQASFSFRAGFDAESRIWKNSLGGGGILDVGCYPVSFARLVAGVATGQDFLDPIEVKGQGVLNQQTGVDEYAAAVLKFPNAVIAQVSTGIAVDQDNVARVYGTEGHLEIPTPWVPAREGGAVKIMLHRANAKGPEEIIVETSEYLYGLEADTVARYIDQRQAAAPAMSWDDTLGNMRVLDQWRAAVGVVYEQEKAGNSKTTVAGRTLAVRQNCRMKYGHVPGLNKSVSRVIFGCDHQVAFSHGSVMWDDFFEQGGNCFDTAWVYGGGLQEKLLGQWVKTRGIREQVVLISKGAHPPWCTPTAMRKHLLESLDRLGTDYTDMYFMHRDNPEVPVGEFCDVMTEWARQGLVKAFGGSNWSIQRVEEFNAYAQKNGKQPMAAVSNNFSLARMVDPVWGGCVSASDPVSRAWFEQHQLTLLPWSSQARGFFTERAGPNKREDAELVRCWYSDDNFRRRERCVELARKKNVLPIQIALAYVLCQPFPTFPLIGPRILSETRTSLPGLNIELSSQDVKWLNLEA